MRIPYFVFTNGEEGENLLDWGVKHSSAFLGGRKNLDTEYQSLLADFKMSPSLEIPEDGKVNLLLLPYKNRNILLGYVFASHDHKGRPNTSTVVCVIPHELQEKRVREVSRQIWNSNNLKGIALREVTRPDMLELDEKSKTEGTYQFVVREWPDNNMGYFSSGNNIRELGRVVKGKIEPDKPDKPDNENSNLRKIILCAAAGAALLIAAAVGFNLYSRIQRQKEEEARLEQERLENERLAKLAAEEQAKKIADEQRALQNQKIADAENKLQDAEKYLSDTSGAGNAKSIALNVFDSLRMFDESTEFSGRVSTLKFRAQRIIERSDEMIRIAEEKRSEAERQRVKNIIASLKAFPELEAMPLISADNFLPPSGNEIDSPFGKLRVCRIDIDDDYSFVNAEALKNILMSFCGEEYKFNNPDKCFAFSFKGTRAYFENKLLSSEIFTSIHDVKPSRSTSTINLEEYLTQAKQQNFRLFYKCEGNEYVIVCVNAGSSPQIYLGTKSNSLPVNSKIFCEELMREIEVNDIQKTITFYLKHSDSKLMTLDADGKFKIFIEQLTGGGYDE